jgi:hypothetical protein
LNKILLFKTIQLSETGFNLMMQVLYSFTIHQFENLFSNQENAFLISDAPYNYEYEGCHIKGSINMNLFNSLQHLFEVCDLSAKFIIVHSEYSSIHGPCLVQPISALDPERNPNKL